MSGPTFNSAGQGAMWNRYEVPISATTEAGETQPVMLRYNPDELHEVIKGLDQLFTDLVNDRVQIDELYYYLVPPSRDWASVAFIERHRLALDNLVVAHESLITEVTRLLAAHVKAKGDLEDVEDVNATMVRSILREADE